MPEMDLIYISAGILIVGVIISVYLYKSRKRRLQILAIIDPILSSLNAEEKTILNVMMSNVMLERFNVDWGTPKINIASEMGIDFENKSQEDIEEIIDGFAKRLVDSGIAWDKMVPFARGKLPSLVINWDWGDLIRRQFYRQ